MKKGCLKHRYYPSGLRREKRASGRTLMSYTYDLDGRKISQRNLTGKSTGYAYNRNGMLSQVMENGRCLAAYEYYADGNIKSLRIGTDLITDYAYDLNKNLTTIRTTLGGGSIVCDNKYTYDGNGNRLSKADRQGLTKYAYDANNQLVQVQYPQGGLENYSYDAAGNRLGRSADGIQENYRYDNCNRLIQLTRMTTQQETVTYSYDRQGNMLSDGRNRYAYDDFGRLASTVTAEGDIQKNCYDAEGLRAEMEENGRLVQFLYNEDREVVAEKDYSGNLIRYIRGLGLISSDSENAKTYYHYVSDEQGSVSHIIRDEDKESGVSAQGREQDRILNQYEYDAFGNTISCKEQVENRFRYQGEQYDPITRQYYLRARYYNPVIGRFIQEDTYYGDGLNLYEYCRNNTITYKDPTGHNICPTQRDLYHKYKEEGMSPQEAYQKMRKELGLDSKSGYKDSGVGNGKDPWRSYESGRETELFLPDEYYQKLDYNIEKAIAARDAEVARIQGLSKTQQSNIATVVAGVDIRTGEVYVGVKNSRTYKGNATCAEDIVFRGLGGNTNANIIMTPAIRPRNNEVIPVCTRCQTKYPQNQFVKGTTFQ